MSRSYERATKERGDPVNDRRGADDVEHGVSTQDDSRIEELVSRLKRHETRLTKLEAENDWYRARLDELRSVLRGIVEDRSDGAESEILEADHGFEYGFTTDNDDVNPDPIMVAAEARSIDELLDVPVIRYRFEYACADSQCSEAVAKRILEVIVQDGPTTVSSLAGRLDRSPVAVQSLLSELTTRGVLERKPDGAYGPSDRLATLAAGDDVE